MSWLDAMGQAYEHAADAARNAEAAATRMPEAAPDTLRAGRWAEVSCAWSEVGELAQSIANYTEEMTKVEATPNDYLTAQVQREQMLRHEANTIAEHLETAQRVIAVLMSRQGIDSVAIPESEWDDYGDANFTVTVTGDSARVIRRVS